MLLCQNILYCLILNYALHCVHCSFNPQNHTVERMWPEVNKRVNFPIKSALIQMVDQESLDMEDGLMRYCVSNLTCQISQIGVQRFVHAWNSHNITGMLDSVFTFTQKKGLLIYIGTICRHF